jgi:hypothetical protein
MAAGQQWRYLLLWGYMPQLLLIVSKEADLLHVQVGA